MHRLIRAAVIAVAVLTASSAAFPSAGAVGHRAAPVVTIATVAPSPYLAASDTLVVTGTTSNTTDSVSVALTPVIIPLTTVSTSASVAGTKTWTATFTRSQLGQIADGTATVTVTSTQLGQSGTATRTFVKDTVIPAVTGQAVTPTLMGSANLAATVSGTVNNSTGLGATGEVGDVVTISADDTDAATSPVTATATTGAGGAFSTTVSTTSLTDGTITYTYVARDTAGNPSAAVTRTNTKDATPPPAPTVTVAPRPIVNATKAAVTVSGTTAGSATSVAISVTDGVHPPVTSSATVSSNAYSRSAIDVTSLNDGTLTVGVTATDAAGNVGPATTTTVVKDTTLPTTTLVAPAYVTPSTVASVPVSGDSEPGATVAVKAVSAGTTTPSVTGSVVVPGDGHWMLALNTSALAEGDLTITATPTDASGNPGAVTTRTSVKDTTAPVAPSVTPSPSPYSTGSFVVTGSTAFADRAATLTVDVTVTDVDGLTLTLPAQPVTPGTSAGSFSVSFTATQMSTLAEGDLTVTAVLRDAAGNVSPTTTVSAENGLLRQVSTSPTNGSSVAPPTTVSATYNQVLSSTGSTTTSSIVVKNSAGSTVAGTTAVSGRTIAFTPTAALPEGGYTVTVTAYDRMYTSETVTDTFAFTAAYVPLVPPRITFFTDPVNTTNTNAVVVSGTADLPGKPVTVRIAGLSRTVNAATDKTWSVTFGVSGLADGLLTASATQSDGSRTSDASTYTTTKDTVAPTRVSSAPASGATVASLTSVRVAFDEEVAATSTLTVAGVTGSSSISGSTLVFTAGAPLAEGTYTATARATDFAANTTTATVTFTVRRTASSITLEPLPASIVAGGSITLRGQVTQTSKASYGDLVLQTVSASGQVVSFATLRPGTSGAFVKTIRPTFNATYQVQYAGDGANTASTSPQRHTDVALKVSASTRRGKATTNAVVTGVVLPGATSTVVTLYKLVGSQYVKLATTHPTARKTYTFSVRLPKGTTHLAVLATHPDNVAGLAKVDAVRT